MPLNIKWQRYCSMSTSETFSQDRMDRCAEIQHSIMTNWQKTNSFTYVVRATESVAGIDLAELRKHYFTVGVGDNLRDIPFHDMLVVFSLIEQQCAAMEKHKNDPNAKNKKEFTIKYTISTAFHNKEAVRLLSGIQIETPFDDRKFLRIQAQ